jgi:hypothetical protein
MKVSTQALKAMTIEGWYADVYPVGHFAKDCPNQTERPPRTCRNCG